MEPTGERTVPGIDREQYFFARHDAVYRWIIDQFPDEIRGARLIDAGSGEGFGAAFLAEAGPTIVAALEYDIEACRHSAATYPRPRTVRTNLAQLPLRDAAVDIVVSLQVIEHLWDLPGFLRDLCRVTRTAGLLIASTPNRETFSPGLGRGQTPVNPFHVEEFDAEQLHDLVTEAGWRDTALFGLHHGPRITDWEAMHGPIVAAQIAAMSHEMWPDDLHQFIARITPADFIIDTNTAAAQDLIVVGRAPDRSHS
jgi:SAM-dependent methyltransferase